MPAKSINETSRWAAFWDVDVRTVQKWINREFFSFDPVEMAHRIAQTPRMSKRAVLRAQAVLSGNYDPEEIKTSRRPDKSSADEEIKGREAWGYQEADTGMSLGEYCESISRRLTAARDSKNANLIKDLETSFFRAREAVRKEEDHLRKMGLDDGELITREMLVRLLYQFCWSLVRGVDGTSAKLARDCVKMDYPEEVYFVAQPILMNSNYAVPLLSMMSYAESVGFPAWVLEVLKDIFGEFHSAGDAVNEDYEKVFREILDDVDTPATVD